MAAARSRCSCIDLHSFPDATMPVLIHQSSASGREPSSTSSSATAIDSSNKGFQLLKKHGWKEGTGLGVSEQGRLEPLKAHPKNNKRGLGADRVKKKVPKTSNTGASGGKDEKEELQSEKSKALSKKARKRLELEKRLQEKEFERAFFREFWPENV